jgi:hypothetical protein
MLQHDSTLFACSTLHSNLAHSGHERQSLPVIVPA